MAKRKVQMGFYEAARDVLIAAINKGQLVGLATLVIGAIVVCRMSSDSLDQVVSKFVDGIERRYILGWIFSVLLLIGWIVHGRFLIKSNYKEQNRMADQRNRAQEQLGIQRGSSR